MTDYNLMTEAEQIAAVKKDADVIKSILNPSLMVQFAAVETKPTIIILYDYPHPLAFLLAVLIQENKRYLFDQFMNNPSPEVQEEIIIRRKFYELLKYPNDMPTIDPLVKMKADMSM